MKDEDVLSEEEIEAQDDAEQVALFQKGKSRSQGIIAVAILVAVIGGLLLIIGLALYLALSLQTTPTVYISSAQSSFQSKDQISFHPRTAQKSQPTLFQELQQSYIKLDLGKPSAQNLVNVQLANSAHLAYRKTIRRLDYENMKKIVQPYSRDLLTSESHITYADYLQAVELLQLTTFPIIDFSPQKIEIQYAERQKYQRKYSISGMRDELKISVIVSLTKKGLQNGDYLYALKSIYQQKYSNFEVIVIDNTPEMGMQKDIVDLLTQIGQNKTIILDKKAGNSENHEGGAVYYALHKYCLRSDLVMLLRDSGQLIGRYAFSLLNELHQSKQTPIIFTNYILEMGNSVAKLEDGYRYKLQIYPSLKNSANSRFDSYKTKYLKSYSAEVLLDLPYTVFQNSKEQWNSGLFEANIEFAALQVSCGNYYLLEEILYRTSKLDLQTAEQINDAREHEKQVCGGTQNSQEKSEADKQLEAKAYEKSLLSIGDIKSFNISELPLYRQRLNEFHVKRLTKWSNALQYYENREKQIDKDSEIKPLSGIKISQMTHSIRQAFMHSRLNIYGEVKTLNPEIFESIQKKSTLVRPTNNSMPIPIPSQLVPHIEVNSFCIILHIEGGNSEFRPYYSLQSILKQKYSKYKAIIIDNASTDNTTQSLILHLNFIPDEQKKKIKYYKNTEKRSKMENIYFLSQLFCDEEDIMIIVDGEEEIIGSTSLQKIDKAYNEKQALAVYSNYLVFEADKELPQLGQSRPYSKNSIDNKNYRKQALLFNQLRSFKTSLFHKIKVQDLKDSQGNWIQNDLQFALSFPILEMACGKTHYLNEILYFTSAAHQFPSKQLLPENIIKIKKKTSQHKFSPLSIYNQQILAQSKYICQQYVPSSSQLRGNP